MVPRYVRALCLGAVNLNHTKFLSPALCLPILLFLSIVFLLGGSPRRYDKDPVLGRYTFDNLGFVLLYFILNISSVVDFFFLSVLDIHGESIRFTFSHSHSALPPRLPLHTHLSVLAR